MICATLTPHSYCVPAVSPKLISERFGHSNVGSPFDICGHILPGMEERPGCELDSGRLFAA